MRSTSITKNTSIATKKYRIIKINKQNTQKITDTVALEAPLEIQLVYFEQGKQEKRSLSTTMRTPGADQELALGFLYTEGIIGSFANLQKIEQSENTLKIYLSKDLSIEWEHLDRSFLSTSSCGICGKPSLDSLEKTTCYFPIPAKPLIKKEIIHQLATTLRKQQSVFKQTGGIHAAGLFEVDGTLVNFKEDIGRHNALDKLIGQAVLQDTIPLRHQLLFLSGRISFELVQKASMVGIPIIAAVGAPSSLAIDLAMTNGITLIGFVREERFNVYCGEERVLF